MKKACFLFCALLVGCQSAPRPTSGTMTPAETATSAQADAASRRLDALEIVSKAVTEKPAAIPGEGWESLFEGKSLSGWRVIPFAGAGDVQIHSGAIILGMGSPFTGISYSNQFPSMNYEVALEAIRAGGSDFFCGLTFPVGESFCSLICGGWGGAVTGLSSLDGMDASENETTRFVNYEKGRWCLIRLRVTEKKIEVWIDGKKLIDVDTTGRKISLRAGEIEITKPFGICSWETSSALRQIKVRRVEGPADPAK